MPWDDNTPLWVHETMSNMSIVGYFDLLQAKGNSTLKFIVTSHSPFYREELPKDISPPSLHIMTKILTWFLQGPLQLLCCY